MRFCFIVSISISRTVFCSSPAEVVPATSAGADALGEAARAAFFSAGNVGSASSQDTATSSAISGGIVLRWVRNPNVKRSEEHTSELQSRLHLVCRLLLEKKK